ncbi:outer membrane protein [Qipengyuania atrilutea]|uniref:Outer membrane beta-barrel protein n=1 Tax=Qipengyuania atrilutea TaxID=2744473 RepID=A0A850GZS7_9SPHN|nr:outer membrane beta-barrel protein [Actirhodobacter atriluteus]NVD43502.1 outer membrane beta-barrel protein [Actirhodobacter atriluteus]
MKKLLLGAGLCLCSSPVFAQEVDTFEGLRTGVLVGWDRFDISVDDGEDELEGNTDDIFYGAEAGYDIQSGNFLFGVEGEVSSSGNGFEEELTETIDGSVYDGTLSLEDGLNWYLGGRIGVVSGANLFYGKAGYANTTLDLDAEGTVDGEPASDSADFRFSGIRLGVGYERSFGGFLGKIEYRYTSYQDSEFDYDGFNVDLEEELGEFDLERHQIVAGLGFRF